MKWKRWLPALLLLSSCAHLRATPGESWQRSRLWDEAHNFFATSAFESADSVFALLAERYPDSNEGREALFYMGVLSLDARNPGFDPKPAEMHLQRYLLIDSGGPAQIHRRPEAETLFELAHQLNLPTDERITALQQPVERTTVVVRERAPQTLGEENERLRRELATRDAEIRRQREELDRIRRLLTEGQGQEEE